MHRAWSSQLIILVHTMRTWVVRVHINNRTAKNANYTKTLELNLIAMKQTVSTCNSPTPNHSPKSYVPCYAQSQEDAIKTMYSVACIVLPRSARRLKLEIDYSTTTKAGRNTRRLGSDCVKSGSSCIRRIEEVVMSHKCSQSLT